MIVKALNDPSYEYEDTSVQIRISNIYSKYCAVRTPIYSRAAMHFVQGSVELGYEECEFFLPNIPRLSAIALVRAMKEYGVILWYEKDESGEEYEDGLLFHADLSNSIFFT